MQNKTKTKLWIVLILTTLVIGGGLAGYVGQEGLFKGLFFGSPDLVPSGSDAITTAPIQQATDDEAGVNIPAGTATGAGTQPVAGGISYDCGNYDDHNSCIAYTECLWDTTSNDVACVDPNTYVQPEGYRYPLEPVLKVGKNTSLAETTVTQGANNVLVGAFKLKNMSNQRVWVNGITFYKGTPGGPSYTLDNQHLSNIKIYSGESEITVISVGGLVERSSGINPINFIRENGSNLFSIAGFGTKYINIRADISGLAPVGKKFRFELLRDSIRTNNPVRTRLAVGNTLPIRSASFTIGAGAVTPEPADQLPPEAPPETPPGASLDPPPATPTITVALATGTPAAREVNTGEFFEAAKVNFAVEGTTTVVFISSIVINAKNITGANALSPDKIDKVQLCKSSADGADVCFPESDFNTDNTMIGTPGWFISPRRSSQNLIIKAKLKADADSGKRFALGISDSNSIDLDYVTPATISGPPIWGNEMTVVTPLACTGERTNIDGVCVCQAPLFEYAGGTAGTHYSPSACIPCTVAELITAGGFYCPRDLPAQPITCNSLAIAPGEFPSNVPMQNFTAIVEPAGFTGTVTWTHLKNGSSIETKTGRQTLFPQLDATSVITANARPETSGRICSGQVSAGAPVVAGDPPSNGGGSDGEGRYVRINRGGYDVGFDQTGAAPIQPTPTNSAGVSAPATPAAPAAPVAPAAPDLSSSQRLRSAPERGDTGPSAVIYVIAMAAVYGGGIIRKKFRGKKQIK